MTRVFGRREDLDLLLCVLLVEVYLEQMVVLVEHLGVAD